MSAEIDQSGKIENTSVDTVIGLANKIHRSVLLPAREKRKLQTLFRQKKRHPSFPYRVFAALISITIQDSLSSLPELVIDTEYTGKDDLIKFYLIGYIKKFRRHSPLPDITFRSIGRKSPAHILAINTYRKHSKPNYKISAAEVARIALK